MPAEFTPGPWRAVPQNDGSYMIARITETESQTKPRAMRLIAHMGPAPSAARRSRLLARLNSLQEDDANARLIAKAPELLAALKKFLEFTDFNCDENHSPAVAEEARALIAEIEGNP